MKEGRRKQTGMVQGLFRCCLQKRSSLFYKPCQEQNTVKPLAVLTVVVQRQDGMSLGGEDLLCSFPGKSLEGAFSDLLATCCQQFL